MKDISFFFTLFSTLDSHNILFSQSNQTNKFACGTDLMINQLAKDNPNLNKTFEDLNNRINANTSNIIDSNTQLTIPVVVFVVASANDAPENISDDQINGQIRSLNNYFSSSNIKFCLARRSTSLGTTTSGIIRNVSAYTDNNFNDYQYLNGIATAAGFNSNKYLRIWIVRNILGSNTSNSAIQGYSSFPGTASFFDGIVIKASAFGDVNDCNNLCSNLNANTANGKVLVHEIGHYLGLYHTFEGGCSGGELSNCDSLGDRICDTPPVAIPNQGCPSTIDSCPDYQNLPDNINNYMDYVNETCMNEFTPLQKQRMINVIINERAELSTFQNLAETYVSCFINNFRADFTADKYIVCGNNGLVNFSQGIFNNVSPTSTILWNFGDPNSPNNTSSILNPTHLYNTSSDTAYIVTLTITNGSNSISSTKKIIVNNCIPILNTQSNWRFGKDRGIDFSSGVPIVVPDSNPSIVSYENNESTSNQSDENGNFLFQSTGLKIHNSNNVVVSANLLGGLSSMQGTLIVPNPNTNFPNQYYVFTKKEYENSQLISDLLYTIVNATNGSNVTVDPLNINIPVTIPSSFNYIQNTNTSFDGGESITAISSCDGYWIITTGKKTSGFFIVVFKLDINGITFVSEFPIDSNFNSKILSIKAAPNGNKIVLSGLQGYPLAGGMYLFNFNKYTGIVSNSISLNERNSYGASFSPNSNFLYYKSNNNKLIQFDLNENNLNVAKKELFSFTNGPDGKTSSYQLGPDNRIYLATDALSLSVINNPDNLITQNNPNATNFILGGVPFIDSGVGYGRGLPNTIDAKSITSYNNSISHYSESCLKYNFFPNACGENFIWNFGDIISGMNNVVYGTNVSHTFTQPGTYKVTLSNSNGLITSKTIAVGMLNEYLISGSSQACLDNISNNSISLSNNESVN